MCHPASLHILAPDKSMSVMLFGFQNAKIFMYMIVLVIISVLEMYAN